MATWDVFTSEKVLAAYMKIPTYIAGLVNLNTFPTTPDPVVLQWVANLMQEGTAP